MPLTCDFQAFYFLIVSGNFYVFANTLAIRFKQNNLLLCIRLFNVVCLKQIIVSSSDSETRDTRAQPE